VLTGVYSPEQASQGRRVFDRSCGLCHGPMEFSGRHFQLSWGNQPLAVLYRQIRNTMPVDNPGSLSTAEYAAVLAYLLQLNGYPAGQHALAADVEALGRIRMVPLPDDRE
jgi:S-disulfanyl-L-cysteine oxidoreductase SoxD